MKRQQTNSKLQTVGPNTGDEELRQWLAHHIEQHSHLNTSVLSKSDYTGVSRPALDGYLEGTYFLPKTSGGAGVDPRRSDVEKKIRAYREKIEGVVTESGALSFIETVAYQRLCGAWDMAVQHNAIIVAYSGPGDGKSHNIPQLKVQRMTTMPISILCSRNITTGYFAQRLAEEASLSIHHSIPRLEDMVADKLRKNPRGVIVDQANYLNEKSLGTVCHVWERARVPIMLVGTNDLYDLFQKSDLTQDVRAQLTSRVMWHVPLAKLTVKECKTFLHRAMGAKHATDEVVAAVMTVTGGCFRSVRFMIPQIEELKRIPTNEQKLRDGKLKMTDIVMAAGTRLMAA
jgi:DNA transposition AAA+ family ATPase